MRILFMMLVLIASTAVAYGGGRFMEAQDRIPREITGQCAYYDMDNGHFKWGARPVMVQSNAASELQAPPDLRDALEMKPAPKHKPKVPHFSNAPTINDLAGTPAK